MLSDFLSLIYPATCINCKETLISAENFVCTSCKIDLPVTDDHKNPENLLFQKFAYNKTIKSASAFLYFTEGGIAQRLIHQLKYEGANEIGDLLGDLYGNIISDKFCPNLIIPVPIHKRKLRRRGYNQGVGFARGLADSFDDCEVREDLIFRIKNTETQTRKNKLSRWLNVDNIYSDVEEDLSSKIVFVVDDVVTTGATIGMLCDKLIEANAAEIHVLCMARR